MINKLVLQITLHFECAQDQDCYQCG